MMSLPVVFIALLALFQRQATVVASKCPGKADIVFCFDSSGSVGAGNYKKVLQFAADLTKNSKIGPDGFRFAAVVFSHVAIKLFDLKDYNDSASLEKKILKAPYFKRTTHTDKAIRLIFDLQMFSTKAGGRPGASKLLIIITDGKSENTTRTLDATDNLKGIGVIIMVVAIGKVDQFELRGMASSDKNVFTADNFDALKAIQEKVGERTCEVPKEEAEQVIVPVPGLISKDGQCFLRLHRNRSSQNNECLYQCEITGPDELAETVRQQHIQINDLKTSLTDLTRTLTSIDNQSKQARARLFTKSSEYNGKFYLLSKNVNIHAKNSQILCEQEGGYLAKMNDAGENAFVVNFLKTQSSTALIGGTDEAQEGQWVWRAGQGTFSFTDWYTNTPTTNEDLNCLFISLYYSSKWVDASCTLDRSFLCEIPKR